VIFFGNKFEKTVSNKFLLKFTQEETTMLKNSFFLILLVLVINISGISAQSPEIPKQISKGVVNGSAVSLPKPSYPAAAKAVNASGIVNVQVLIDEEGNVVSASAVSGHPLLRAAAEQAARGAKFKKTLLQGQPVKVNGVIIYSFVMPMSFTQIGYELAFAEKSSPLPENFPSVSIASNLPKDWEKEKSEIFAIGDFISAQNSTGKSEPLREQDTSETKIPEAKKQTDSAATPAPKGTFIIDPLPRTSGVSFATVEIKDPVQTLKNIQTEIENRLSGDKRNLWNFRLGRILGSIAAEINTGEKVLINVTELNRLIADAPSNVPDSTINRAKEIVVFSQQGVLDAEMKNRLLILVKSLR
jgi:TonB family protein